MSMPDSLVAVCRSARRSCSKDSRPIVVFEAPSAKLKIERLRLVVDQSKLAIEQAVHQQDVAKSRALERMALVRVAETKLDQHRIKATVAGTVVEVFVEPGEWVEAGKPVARLISLDPIRVECFVDGRVYGPELEGRQVTFTQANSATEPASKPIVLKGHVSFVARELNPLNGQARLWATIENPQRQARAGMRGRLSIEPADKDPVETR